jgi:hypothetical protein
MGEGTGGFQLHSFSNPQQVAIMIITVVAMAATASVYKVSLKPDVALRSQGILETLPNTAYFAFAFYAIGLGLVFLIRPAIPIQTILLVMTVAVMMLGKVKIKDLIGSIILHPVTAMVAGFMMGGSLFAAGAFDALIRLLSWIAVHTPLGFIGVSVLLIYLPIIFPMPCGRIMAAALLPGVIMFGGEVARATGQIQVIPPMLIAFILSCAASCGQSPLGGIGGIGEGNLGLRRGVSSAPLQLGIILGIPFSALIVRYFGLSHELVRVNELLLALGVGFLSGLSVNVMLGFRFYKPGGILGGVLSGLLITFL